MSAVRGTLHIMWKILARLVKSWKTGGKSADCLFTPSLEKIIRPHLKIVSDAGPAEWTPYGFNQTWFFPEPASHQVPGDRTHSIFATSWRKTEDGTFPLIWASEVDYVNAVDVTDSYRNLPLKQAPVF